MGRHTTYTQEAAGLTGYGLNEARHSSKLPIVKNMTLAKSAALWLAIFAGLCAFTAGVQWLVDAGAL